MTKKQEFLDQFIATARLHGCRSWQEQLPRRAVYSRTASWVASLHRGTQHQIISRTRALAGKTMNKLQTKICLPVVDQELYFVFKKVSRCRE